ncbi:MAG TPA: DUF6599 family protein [Pyrinomonadaceae bacterium]
MLWLRDTLLRMPVFSKLFFVCALLTLLCVPAPMHAADLSVEEAARLLPESIGDFHARGRAKTPTLGIFEQHSPEDFGVMAYAARAYTSPDGETFVIDLVTTRSDSGAYALLKSVGMFPASSPSFALNDVGTAGIATPAGVMFFKGRAFASVYNANKTAKGNEGVLAFARLFAQTLDKGEGEIPVLVKHLPDWEKTQERSSYAISLHGLQKATGNLPIFDAVSFEGRTEAVIAPYGSARLVIAEYSTPQIAADSDTRIRERLKQLKETGQPVPTAYRRVGNYSVFVFDAPDERTATQLIDQISYEQVVQWLGTNPHIYERLQREYAETTAGVIVSVLKASGLSLVLCFGLGALFGGLVFMRRRAQAAAVKAYSDAGGLLRLNIDELTAQTDPGKLLGRGDHL